MMLESELEGGDSAPGFGEIARGETFEGGVAGGMIRGDEVDGSILQRVPEFFVVVALADGGGAFESSCGARDFFGGEK